MKSRTLVISPSQRRAMSNYYREQSHFYDATQWMFLYGRNTVVEQTDIRPGDRVVEIGCGNGSNFQAIQRRLLGSGEILGVDCARPMLDKAARRIRENRWKNVRLIDVEYGKEVITRGRTNVVLFSYSLSMISDWKLALACAHAELWPGGRIGVVDCCKLSNGSKLFSNWLAVNHIHTDRPCETELCRLFDETARNRYTAWAGLWSFYLFVGMRRNLSIAQQ